MNFVKIYLLVGLCSLFFSSCCESIQKQLDLAIIENNRLNEVNDEFQEEITTHLETIDSLSLNQSDVKYPLGDKFLRCFVYAQNDRTKYGILRPIVEFEAGWDYLPVILYEETPGGVAHDSIVYAKLKLNNDIPFGVELSKNIGSGKEFMLNHKDSIIKLKDYIPLDMHSTSESEDHNPNSLHKRGHMWLTETSGNETSRIAGSSSDTRFEIVYVLYTENDIRPTSLDAHIGQRDTFYVDVNIYNELDLSKRYYWREFIHFTRNGKKYPVISDFDLRHRHTQHPHEFHLKRQE